MSGGGPPRALQPGDIVVTYNRRLGGWAAAQIISLDSFAPNIVSVLELDWTGPEPQSVADLAGAAPLRLTHHAHTGRLSYSNVEWTLPKGCRVLGSLPLMITSPSDSYKGGWHLGDQLAWQRAWDRGEEQAQDPSALTCTAAELNRLLAAEPQLHVLELKVADIEHLDVAQLTQTFPRLDTLSLTGLLGELSNAGAINDLQDLEHLHIQDLFGMTATEIPHPKSLAKLEFIGMYSTPKEYSKATRRTWAPHVNEGISMEIRQGRDDDWVAENRDNPLRDWDGREHISAAAYRKSVNAYRETRRAVLAAQDQGNGLDAYRQIAAEFAVALNIISRRSQFIETEEREEVFDALRHLAQTNCTDSEIVLNALFQGLDDRRSGERAST